jgi:DNA-binding MarR family transcriptional regulator
MSQYINFINRKNRILESDKFPNLTLKSKLILDQIALHVFAEKPLTIRQAMSFDQIASPATLHKNLSTLRSSGYISAISLNTDKRTKHLVLTSLGHRYVKALSKAIVLAAADNQIPDLNLNVVLNDTE